MMRRWKSPGQDKVLRNRAVLVSVAQFHGDVALGRRGGAKKDDKRLHKTLSRLGFQVDMHVDLGGEEIEALFETESRRPVRDCFLAVLSSHGQDGFLFGADGKPVRLSRLFSHFDNAHMESKVKVFLVQACRGGALDDGVEVDSVDGDSDFSFSQYDSIPIDAAVMYATVQGYAAFSHPLGSVFLQTFCSLLEEDGNRQLELTRLLTRLSHRVAYGFQAKGRHLDGKKQMPCLLSRLTRDAFPFARNEGDALGLSATALLGPEDTPGRTRSIS